jgi:hypothetical protein
MSTTSKIQVTEGSGKNLAAYQITEDSIFKDVQRVVQNDSTGAEITQPLTDTQIRATPLPVSVSGVATAANQATGNASVASIDTKLSSQATAAKQDTGNTSLSSIDTKLSSQSTAANQATGNTSLGSIDTKLTSQATATKQDLQTTALNSILAELQNDTAFSETVWYDANATTDFYIRVATVNEQTGVKTITFQHIDGTAANVTGLTLVQAISNSDFEFNSVVYKANIAGTGYSIGDRIQKLQIINMITATLVNTIWNNETTGAILGTPPTFSNLVIDDTYATAALQTTGNTSLSSIDTKLTNNATTTLQTTGNTSLASIDTKLSSQSTAANQSTANTSLSSIDTKMSLQSTLTEQQTQTTKLTSIDAKDFATQTTLALIKAKTDNIDVLLSTRTKPLDTQKVDGSAVTQPISASALPLPTGASTAANQATEIASLSSIDGKLTNNATTTLQTTGNTSLSSIDTKTPALGQALAAASTPVVLTAIQQAALTPQTNALTDAQLRASAVPVSGSFFQTTQPISATALPLPTGAATAANQATEITSLNSIDTKTPTLGQALAASSTPVVLTAIQQAALTPPAAITGFALEATQVAEGVLIGAVTETAPANDTASSGLNGRLQRIAQRITSLIAQIPATLGTKTIANSMAVNIASDQSIPLSDGIKQTYSGGSVVAPVALATDVWILNGSATKTVRIRKIELIGSQTTGGYFTVILQKRSTANTGASANVQRVPNDSLSAASTVTYQSYTANPTALGTNIGSIRTEKIFFPAATLGTTKTVWEFGNSFDQALTLRGVGEGLALNLGGVTLTGGSLSFNVVWTEE